MTKITSPNWGHDTVNIARDVVKNNRQIKSALITLETDLTWLPHVLVEAGFFPSGSEIKRNQPKFWRDLVPGETIKLSWCEVTIGVSSVG